MADNSRSGKTADGSSSYREGQYEITRMGDDRWYVFLDHSDTGHDFETLRAARAWCRKAVA